MMSGLRLETFEIPSDPVEAPAVPPPDPVDDGQLRAYEEGYAAGWEDAAAAQASEDTRVRADVARGLQSLGFTFEEARAHVTAAMVPLLQELVTHLLPAVARLSLGPTIAELLQEEVESAANYPIGLRFAPPARQAIEEALRPLSLPPFTLEEDPGLGECQVILHLARRETLVDLDRAAAALTTLIHDYFNIPPQEQTHG